MKRTFARLLTRSLGLLALIALGGYYTSDAATLSLRPAATFNTGQLHLLPTQRVLSRNGQYWLTLQSAGNVVLYNIFQPLFSTNTVGKNATQLTFQTDGNLVLYSGSTPLWASNTSGHPSATLTLQDDGNLVIYTNTGTALWSTATSSGSTLQATASDIVNGPVAYTKIVTPVFPTSDVVISDYDAVVNFGADSSGVADSTANIQNALNTCSTNGGGTVWLPKGSYVVSSTITIPAYCTLRGDWRPLTGSPSGGTIIKAQVTSGASGPSVFSIGASAALMGVVIYYPSQNINNVVPYGYSIIVPSVPAGVINASIINVTLLNAYAGILISSNPTYPHEGATVLNVEGTVLFRGLNSTNCSDFDAYENISFGPQYWSQATDPTDPTNPFNAPDLATLTSYTQANAYAFLFGDVEWGQFLNLKADSFHVGIYTYLGTRTHFSGEFDNAQISNSVYGVNTTDIYQYWNQGVIFAGGSISGSVDAVLNASSSGNSVTLNDTAIQGPLSGTVNVITAGIGPPAVFQEPATSSIPKTTSVTLYDVSQPPYSAIRVLPNAQGLIPFYDIDATASIQQALNAAGANGGGVVYLPAGWYYMVGTLTVPANVELRGATSAPARDQTNLSGGTVLFTAVGRDSPTVATDPAFITLSGNQAGASGLVIFYPNNNPAYSLNETYPYAIRASGSSTYVKNVAISNGFYGIDFKTYANPGHWLERVEGVANENLIAVGNGGGTIRNITSNPSSAFRNGYNLQHWPYGDTSVVDSLVAANQTRLTEISLVSTDGSLDQLANISSYAASVGIVNQKPGVTVFNMATDGLGVATIDALSSIDVVNVLRFSGTTAEGSDAFIWNDDDLIN
jgi:hypothetical protein